MSPELRVLMVSHPTKMSGAEHSMLELIETLSPRVEFLIATPRGEVSAELGVRGHEPLELAPVDLSFRLHPRRTLVGLAWIPLTARRIRQIASAGGVDLIHANTTRAALPSILAGLGGGPPVVSHIRDKVPPGLPGRAVLGSVRMFSDWVIANSNSVRREISGSHRGTSVVYNSVDTARFDPDRVQGVGVRRELGLGDDPLILMAGHFSPPKAQDDAVRMLAELKRSMPDARLVLAGSAKFTEPGARFDSRGFRAEVAKLAVRLGVGDDVVFAGERSDMPRLMAAANVLVLPSWDEPFGRVVIEAMAMRLPVVVTSVGGPREIVRDGIDGYVRPPRTIGPWVDCLRGILGDPALAAYLGENGLERVRDEFTSERSASAVLKVYRGVLAPPT